MSRFRSVVFSGFLSTATFLQVTAVRAEDDVWLEDDDPEDEGAEDEGAGAEADRPAAEEDASETEEDADTSPVEAPGETYLFVGARYRGIVFPKFMLNLFADGGRSAYVSGIGPELGIRKDNFETILSAWVGFYGLGETPFKGKNDDELAWEIIESNLKVLYLTSDFLWSEPVSSELAINYGVGVGLGFVFGNLFRTQAYPEGDGEIPDNLRKCTRQGVPDPVWCDDANEHYGGFTEPSWFGGGSKPVLFPWLALQTGLRYKPHKNFVARLDLGFGTSGFFFGLGADYGL